MKLVIKVSMLIFLLSLFLNDTSNNINGINIYKLKNKISIKDNIKYICTYDYCDYLQSDNIDESIEIFINKYLKNIKDDEIKNTLKVKGVKIIKIVKRS